MSKSSGICIYCNKSVKSAGLSRHLSTHLKKQEQGGKKVLAFHIKIQEGAYFLHLLMDGNATLKDLDHYLRKIWLECCGHMSEFGYERWSNSPLSSGKKLSQLFEGGESIYYTYDFGSSTELKIKVFKQYAFKPKEPILLLSRNEPLEIYCDVCKKEPAIQICSVHWDGTPTFFCEDCGDEHHDDCEDAEYAMTGLCNSPRTGMCAYSGGSIDTKRDGVFQKK